MGKKDFDNLSLYIKAAVLFASSVLQSVEIDFEIPRGFIVKIWNIELGIQDIPEDIEAFVSTGNNTVEWQMGLLADPDDTTNVLATSNAVLNDHLDEFTYNFWNDVGGTDPQGSNGLILEPRKHLEIPEHIDMILSRNARLNVVATGNTPASITESVGYAIIRYTLEKVTDADILNLLDIL